MPAQAQSALGAQLSVLKATFEEIEAAYRQSDTRCAQAYEDQARYIGPIDNVMEPRDNACAVFSPGGVRTAEWRDCSDSFYDAYEKRRAVYRTCLAEQDRLGDERLALYRDIASVEQEMRSGALVGSPGVPASGGAPGWLGVEAANLKKRHMTELALASLDGAYVKGTKEGSPAEKAGIREGDVIVRIGSNLIARKLDISKASAGFKAGQVLNVDLIRSGEPQTIYVAIEARPLR